MKNPLAGIEVMAGLLRRQMPDRPKRRRCSTDIISEAKMANAIVLEMLEFVRPIRLQVERTDVAEVLQPRRHAGRQQGARAATSTVTLDVAAGLPLIEGDQHQLCQVFTNLLINAFEALDGTGAVTISGARRRRRSRTGARPTACARCRRASSTSPTTARAFRRSLTDRIFSPFFTTKPQGSGLGLAIVRKIVDAHDGRIDLTQPRRERHDDSA